MTFTSVGQRPFRRAVLGVLRGLLHGRTFQSSSFGDQRFLDRVVLVCLDLGCGDLVADGENLLGRRIYDTLLFRCRDDDHLVVGVDRLLCECVDRLDVERLDQHAVQLPFGFGVGHGRILLVVIQVGLYELGVAAVVAVRVRTLGAAHQVVLCTLELTLREAVAAHLLHLRVEGFETLCQFAVLRHGDEGRGLERRDYADAARVHACAQERGVGLHRNLLQTGILHRGHVSLYHVEHLAVYQVVVLLGYGRALYEDLHARTLHFGIGVDADDRLFVVGHRDHLFLCGIGGRGRNIAHQRFELVFDGVDVDVTHDHDRLIVGAVPRVVEILQFLVLEAFQPVEIADQVAVLVFRALAQRLEHLHGRTPRSVVAGAELLHDHAALRVDLLGLEGDEVRPVVQDQQRTVDDALA